MRFVFAFLGMLAFAVVAANPAPAAVVGGDKGESFALPTFRELTQMLVMMGGLDIQNPKIADEYAKLMYCGLYYDKYKNDFEWNKIRQQIINRVGSKKEYYRIQYQMSGTLYLDRYNFETQDFPLGKQSAMTRVGSMILYEGASVQAGEDPLKVRRLCHDAAPTVIFPAFYTFVLNQPLTIDRLKLPVDEAKSLLDRMTQQKNNDRRLYVRIRVRVMGIDRLSGSRNITGVYLKGEVTNVDIFLDYDMTKYLTSVTIK